MSISADQKVTTSHLQRDAYLYVRQSTIRQVFENTESTKRQYGLRQKAVALGWQTENVIVIDSDLGQSGASAADRAGFQRLVTEVGLGRAGIVLGLEVSRLARNSTDWHRLLEICALTDTLILDEDGLYDPSHFNDRLLLGLKGTMSEAELHVLRARLRGGIENKARRGELKSPLPIGLAYDEDDRVVLEPDRQVQATIHKFFKTFEETGSAMATVKHFRQQGWQFPRKLRRGVHKGNIVWGELVHSRALQLLHNPRYAGAFFFGRSRQRKKGDGHVDFRRLPPDQWHTLLPDAHVGYITWDRYQRNVQQLLKNAQSLGGDRRKSPAGEGPALLQGLAMCGLCGKRMTVRYDCRETAPAPRYVCQRDGIEQGQPLCQSIPGKGVDEAIGRLLLEKVTPLALEVTLAVQQELQTRREEADALRKQQVERARYEAELARARFMQVDPRNRLVADALEADWNDTLRNLNDAQELYERCCQQDAAMVVDSTRSQVLELAINFPKLWNDPRTSDRDRKRIVRLLIEDVTLIHEGQITAHVRFQGGVVETLRLPRPLSAWELRQTSPQVVQAIDRLLDDFTEGQVADQLNQQGLRSGTGSSFCGRLVGQIRRAHRIVSRYERLRGAGMLTQHEIAEELNVHPSTVRKWRCCGLLTAHAYNDKNEYLYELPGANRPIKQQGTKLTDPRRFRDFAHERSDEVQHEA
ncbi:MAG: recombinase family protein [Pirellulales bacterium]|nr:recombinase family protein [Pirellulales bacterium]